MKKVWIVVGVILALVLVGVFAFPMVMRNLNPDGAESIWQTETAEKGSLTAFVGASGTVRTNQTATLAWQTSGKVGSVDVQMSQNVSAGEELASLAQSSLSQSIIMAQVDLVNAQRELDKALNNAEARSEAQLTLIQAQQDLEDAEKESRSKLYQRASQNTIDIARANLLLANEELDKAEDFFATHSGGGEGNPTYAAALSQLARARQEQQMAEYNLRYTESLPDPLVVEEVYAKLDQARVKLLSAKEEWERIKDGPDPNDIAAAEARVAAAQAALDLARLTAPFAGVITVIDAQPGDLVSPGSTAFQIDDLSRLLVDVQVSEVDINRVAEGQPVELNFDAVIDQAYQGTVVEINQIGANVNGAVNFIVTVELNNPGQEVKPGMTAAVNIAVSQLEDVLLVPNMAVRVVDGKRVVYILRNGMPVPVEIRLGPSSNTHSQLLQGAVQPGDPIVLNPPTTPLFGPGAGGPMGAQP